MVRRVDRVVAVRCAHFPALLPSRVLMANAPRPLLLNTQLCEVVDWREDGSPTDALAAHQGTHTL